MMKLVIFILCMMIATPGFATSQKSVTPKLKVANEESGPIPSNIINDIYENCLFHIPQRFTPEAREYYCTCNSASLQGNFRMNEYNDLKKISNRKPGNKLFEKYINLAVAPCLDVPVKQIEYLACILDTSNDIRIGYPLSYCSCVSDKMKAHAKALGEAEIMTKLAQNPGAYKEPLDALWNSQNYLSAKYKSRDDCILEGH